MHSGFEIAGGSIPGSAHVRAGRNNQDAFAWLESEEGVVAVVCDGCSSAPHSEVGAKLAARLFARTLLRELASDEPPPARLARAHQETTDALGRVAGMLACEGKEAARAVHDFFLTTAIGVMVDAACATTFAIGDGIAVLNGEPHVFGPFPANEPPYLGYGLLEGNGDARPTLKVGPSVPTEAFESVLVGTDGVLDLDALAERTLETEGGSVGPLRQFWENDGFFRNPDRVRRRLTVINRALQGALADDTTLVVLRRRKEAA